MVLPDAPAESGIFVSSCFDDPRLRDLVGPGGPYEVERIEIDGVPVRAFVRVPATVLDAFRMSAAHAERVHVVLAEDRLTFADMRRQALAVARRLRDDFGVGVGDRVAIAMRNLPEFVVSFWATAVLGAIVVPLNAWWTGPELHYALGDAGVRAVFADAERVERLAGTAQGHSGVPVIGVRTDADAVGVDALFTELTGGDPLEETDFGAVGPDDPVTILYTSGTTGRPKGALNTHRGTMTNIMNMGFAALRAQVLSGRPPRTAPEQAASISAAPLFHIGGIAAIVGGAMAGSKLVLMHKWDVEEGLALAVRENVTSFGGVPAIARQVLEHPDLPKLGLRITGFPMGGAPVAPDLPRRVVEVLGDGVQILNGYGSTETTSAVVTNVGSEYAAHPDSVGRVNLTAELRIEDGEGRPLGVGEVGELCFRSPQVAKGYWNDPEATRASFVDGWFHTGDLGSIDADGFVRVVDRLKDVVIRGGENVYCAEVEAALIEHPAIAEVAVVGLPDQAMGERVCAVVVPHAGESVELGQLREFAAARLAAFKRPEALCVVDEVPRTATGKVAKQEVRALLTGDGARIERLR